jgi:quinol monooxygenase YgiN
MTETLHVVAHIYARLDTVDELRTLLLGLLEPTRQESGCLSYTLMNNQNQPTDFTFVEEWADAAALDAHLAAPHLQAALVQAQPLLAAAPDIRRYSLIG